MDRAFGGPTDSPGGGLDPLGGYGPCVGGGGGSPGPTPGGPIALTPEAGGSLEFPGPSEGLN